MNDLPMRSSGIYDKNSILHLNKITRQPLSSRNMEALRCRDVSPEITPPAPPTPSISHMVIPQLIHPMQKGQKLALSASPAANLDVRIGWNVTDPRCDIDVSAFLLGADQKVPGDDWFVFYGQPESPDKAVVFSPSSAEDREQISLDLTKLNPSVKKIVFVLTINEALKNRLHFGMVKDPYLRIMDPRSGRELVSFRMTETYSNVISMMIGEIYLHGGVWKCSAVGNGIARDLAGLCELYGVQVS